MKVPLLCRSVVVTALLVSLTISAVGQDEKAKKKRAGRGQTAPSFFSADVQKSVPGIRAVVSLSREQRTKMAAIRQAALADEAYKAALKTTKDKSAERKDRRAANRTLRESKAAVQAKLLEVLAAEQRTLVAKINDAAAAAASSVRAEYKQKIKDSKGDKVARKALTKEVGTKVAASVKEQVSGLLSDEQKEAIAAVAKKVGKKRRGNKKKGAEGGKKKGGKKKGDKRKGDADAKKEKEAVS